MKKRNHFILLFILIIFCNTNCTKINESFPFLSYKGKWNYVGSPYTMSIGESTIDQITGFPIVNGINISYKETKKGELKCYYKKLDYVQDSFTIIIQELSDNYMRIYQKNIYLGVSKEFTR